MATMDRSRAPLHLEGIVAAAVRLADAQGIEAVSMRALAASFDVVPMALYRHVASKERLLDAMLEAVIREIPAPAPGGEWHERARGLIVAARHAMARHPWAWRVMEHATTPVPAVLDHQEAMLAVLREGGLSVGLAHHLMHALGSRLWGFTTEVYASAGPPADPAARAALVAAMVARWPRIVESARYSRHDADSVVGQGCDDEAEFLFAVDLILDGARRLHREGWRG